MKDDASRLRKLENEPRRDITFGFRVHRFLLPIAVHLRKKITQQIDTIDLQDTLNNKAYNGIWQFENKGVPGKVSNYVGEVEIVAGFDPGAKHEHVMLTGTFGSTLAVSSEVVKTPSSARSTIRFEIGYSFYYSIDAQEPTDEFGDGKHQFYFKCSGFDKNVSNVITVELRKLGLPELVMSNNGSDFNWAGGDGRAEACFQLLRFAGRRILQAKLLP